MLDKIASLFSHLSCTSLVPPWKALYYAASDRFQMEQRTNALKPCIHYPSFWSIKSLEAHQMQNIMFYNLFFIKRVCEFRPAYSLKQSLFKYFFLFFNKILHSLKKLHNICIQNIIDEAFMCSMCLIVCDRSLKRPLSQKWKREMRVWFLEYRIVVLVVIRDMLNHF